MKQNVDRDLGTEKYFKKLAKEEKKKKDDLNGKHAEILHKAVTQKYETDVENNKTLRLDQRDLFNKQAKNVAKRKKELIEARGMVAEKHRMHESDAIENNKRIETLKQIRNYKVFEKHAMKEKSINDFKSTLS